MGHNSIYLGMYLGILSDLVGNLWVVPKDLLFLTCMRLAMVYTKRFQQNIHREYTNENSSISGTGPLIKNSVTNYGDTTGLADTFTGTYNPAWKAEVRAQSGATTSASGELYEIASLPWLFGELQVERNIAFPSLYQYLNYTCHGNPLSGFPSVFSAVADLNTVNLVTARAYSSFLDEAKSAISSFQSGQDIAELHQTIESIVHPLKSLRAHVSQYFAKASKLKRLRNIPTRKKALADAYLEWTFGWNPLSADIADGIVGLSKNRFNATPVSGYGARNYSGSDLRSQNDTSNLFVVSLRNVKSKYSMRLKGSVNAFYSKSPRVLQELQLLPEDFVPTAWNLLPYSFVIDYFLNIGDIINSYSFPTAAIRWVNESLRDETKTVVTYNGDYRTFNAQFPPDLFVNRVYYVSCNNLDVTYRRFSRSARSSSSITPPLVFEIPKLSAKPWLNMAALVTGSARRLTPFW